MSDGDTTTRITVSAAQQRFASWVADILVSIVVLNLFVEYFPNVIAESFTLTILTAVLLKGMLVVIGGLEHRVSEYFGRRDGAVWKVLRVLSVWLILFASKFVILEVVGFVFGGYVELGHFLEVVALVVALLIASQGLKAVYRRLGRSAAGAPEAG